MVSIFNFCEISLELTSGFQMLAVAMPHYEVLGKSCQLCLLIYKN